jgi:hypothetical protein
MAERNIEKQPETDKKMEKVPDDTGTISITGFVRIHDPETKQVYLEARA